MGFPNAGKSTLISRISAARPKIADYPFTTLEPNLGVVQLDDFRSFVVADIPGLIEGAHQGHGLGIQFLRHIERTRLLAHLVDVSEASGRDPVHDFEIVMAELASFSEELARKPMIVVATKMDAAQDPERVASLRDLAAERGLPFFEISSATGPGHRGAEVRHGRTRADTCACRGLADRARLARAASKSRIQPIKDFGFPFTLALRKYEHWRCASMQFSAYDTHGFYDEMFEDDGRPRPHAQLLLETVESLSDGQLLRYKHAAERLLLQMGITFNVYGDSRRHGADLPVRPDPAHRSGRRVGPHRARPEAAHSRAERCSSTTSITTRRSSRTASFPREVILSAVFYRQQCHGLNPPRRRLVPHHRHRPGARPRRAVSTCSRTTCACPPASPTCWRTAR